MASVADDGTLIIWDAVSGKKRHVLQGHKPGLTYFGTTADGTQVRMHIHARLHTRLHAPTHARPCTHARTQVRMHIHARLHTRIRAPTHA